MLAISSGAWDGVGDVGFRAMKTAMGVVIRGDGIDLKVNDMLLGEWMNMVEIRWTQDLRGKIAACCTVFCNNILVYLDFSGWAGHWAIAFLNREIYGICKYAMFLPELWEPRLQTSNADVFAAGDCLPGPQRFTHAAEWPLGDVGRAEGCTDSLLNRIHVFKVFTK